MSFRISRLLNRLWLLGILAPLAIGCSLYLGMAIGARRWPYEVQNTAVITPNVPPGATFYMARTIDYQDDCELHYDRLMVSDVPGPKGAFRRDVLADINFARPPMELDGRPWYISERVPDDFPCGPAMIIDRPSAACNWFQRLFWRQTRRDAVTRFVVDCSWTTPLP